MANDKKCSDCDAYDPILHGMKETRSGWCVKRSLYPFQDSKGQITPAGAQRVTDPTAPAQPYIVAGAGIKQDCTLFTIKKKRPDKKDLLAAAMGITAPKVK